MANYYSQSRYHQNPYYDRGYGAPLSATQGFLAGHQQYTQQAPQAQWNAYRLSIWSQLNPDEKKAAAFPSLDRGTSVEVNLPGKLWYGAQMRKGGMTPSAITEEIGGLPDYYSKEQVQEYMPAVDIASEYFPKKGFMAAKWGRKDYSEEEVLEKFKEYLERTGYHNKSKSPEQQQALLDAWKSGIGAGDISEVDFDLGSPETQAMLGVRPKPTPQPIAGQPVAGQPINMSAATQSDTAPFTGAARQPLGKQESPYEEWPDAFLENGIWKVWKDGKKWKIEE